MQTINEIDDNSRTFIQFFFFHFYSMTNDKYQIVVRSIIIDIYTCIYAYTVAAARGTQMMVIVFCNDERDVLHLYIHTYMCALKGLIHMCVHMRLYINSYEFF